MKKVELWYSIDCGSDGSAYPRWFLSEKDARQDQVEMVERNGSGWGEYCIGMVETFEGSNIHEMAVGGYK